MSGSELFELRKGNGLTQEELAGMVGVDTSTICRWELGQRPITKRSELAITHALILAKGILAKDRNKGRPQHATQ